MTRMRLGSIRIQAAFIVLLPFLIAGCFFNLSEKEDFQSWYYGDPGLAGALGEADCDRYADNIQGARHPYYLHFRTPEVLLQPQGGAHYPERTTAEHRASRSDAAPAACEKVTRGWETFRFDSVDAGVVDMVIPYRKASAVNDHGTTFGRQSLDYAEGVVYNTALAAVMKAPVYIVHDILKTLYIPVAGTYYLFKPDAPPETASEIGGHQGPSSPDVLFPAGGDESQESAGVAVQEQAPLAFPPPEANGGSKLGEDSDSPITVEMEEEEEFAATSAGPAPETAAGDDRTAEISAAGETGTTVMADGLPAEGETVVEMDAAESQGEIPVDGGTATIPSTTAEPEPDISSFEDAPAEDEMGLTEVEGPEPAATPQTASGAEDFPEEDTSVPAPEHQADMPEDAAAAEPRPAIPEEGTAASATENWPANPPAAPSGGIAEEDLQTAAPLDNALPAVEVTDGAPDQSSEASSVPADETPSPVVSVSPVTPPPLEPIPWVRLAKRKLRKKAAFIGFFSRAVNVDEDTKAYLRDRLWPVFKEQCEDNLTLVRQGDADYPAALNALMRDPYGHLNSFELITVARFNGLNAIISGTIIDIRVSKELGGILWYKSPEGQLRITILVEVYDAETGTKLLDRIYIHEEEVEELEPGAGEKPRGEDQSILEATLRSIAEDMGEDVCEVLEDQPWRAFVAGINGKRITLSAGDSAGLKVGNILGVYNSQIIDGLNNQQFFLTGEKVGRIQIVNLTGRRSEALLIEGQGLRDYSVVIPD